MAKMVKTIVHGPLLTTASTIWSTWGGTDTAYLEFARTDVKLELDAMVGESAFLL